MIMNYIKAFFQDGGDLSMGEDRTAIEIGQKRFQFSGPALHPVNRYTGVVRIVTLPLIGEFIGMRVTGSYNIHAMSVPGQEIGQVIDMKSAAPGMKRGVECGYKAETFLIHLFNQDRPYSKSLLNHEEHEVHEGI